MTEITTNSFAGTNTDDGYLLTEKGNGPVKMMLIFLGLGIAATIIAIPLAVMGGTIGLIFAPILFWGGILIAAACIIAFVLRFAIKRDPNILFNTKTSELRIRGKVIPFADISDINCNIQSMMGKTMVVIFLVVKGRKKSLFSTSVVSDDPGAMENLAEELKALVQA